MYQAYSRMNCCGLVANAFWACGGIVPTMFLTSVAVSFRPLTTATTASGAIGFAASASFAAWTVGAWAYSAANGKRDARINFMRLVP
jgi:hypothetical protein